jgi:hypothetical protein
MAIPQHQESHEGYIKCCSQSALRPRASHHDVLARLADVKPLDGRILIVDKGCGGLRYCVRPFDWLLYP